MCDQIPTIKMEMIDIPAQPFCLGEDEDNHKVTIRPFYMGKFPVTAAQYQCFVDATGYTSPPHWPEGHHHPMMALHPVVNISWYDALAFC
ncbi:MAG: formylglycine-generating enzyme family protein, partial [Anaerolineae bacterium]|nr:formylglycine-generating enzyme family protein [Anaerolineae bacterium]